MTNEPTGVDLESIHLQAVRWIVEFQDPGEPPSSARIAACVQWIKADGRHGRAILNAIAIEKLFASLRTEFWDSVMRDIYLDGILGGDTH